MIFYVKLVFLLIFIGLTNPNALSRIVYLHSKFGISASAAYLVIWLFSRIGLLAGAFIANTVWRLIVCLLVSVSTYFYLVNSAISSSSVGVYSYLEMLINAKSSLPNAIQYYAYYIFQFNVIAVVFIGLFAFLLPIGNKNRYGSQLAKKTKTLLGVYCLPIVLFLGITVMTIHKTINSNRARYKKNKFNFGSMVAGINVSDYSKYFMRVGARPGQHRMGINKHPFIWQYAQ